MSIALLVIAACVATCLLLVWRPKQTLAAIVSVVLTVLLLEVGLRLLQPTAAAEEAMYRLDPELGWTFVPERDGPVRLSTIVEGRFVNRTVRTNAHGFRDRPFEPIATGTRRVLVLGDSFVSNLIVDADAVFTEVMERALDGTTVMNLGVNGYGQVQEWLTLKRHIAELRPDLVLVVIYVRNDLMDNVVDWWVEPFHRPLASLDGSGIRVSAPQVAEADAVARRRLRDRSRLVGFLARRLESLFAAPAAADAPVTATLPQEQYLCNTRPPRDVRAFVDRIFAIERRLLLEIRDVARDHGAEVAFVLAPSHPQADADAWRELLGHDVDPAAYDPALPNRRLLALADDEGLVMLDLLPRLSLEQQNGHEMYDPEDLHWSVAGNRVVAEEILAFLRVRGLVRPSE